MATYIDAIYYVTTTATTVGYGDFYAYEETEKLFVCFLEFAGICIFSAITANIRNLRK